MQKLSQQHCLHHSLREAVARCPECRQFFCRECITEHEDRVLCAGCLRKISTKTARKKGSFAVFGRIVLALVSLIFAWFLFYGVGQLLLSIPAEVHEGSVWKTSFWDE